MDRRHFLASGIATGLASTATFAGSSEKTSVSTTVKPFKLKYAPHFGMFKHHGGEDPLDQLKFMSDEAPAAILPLAVSPWPRRRRREPERCPDPV